MRTRRSWDSQGNPIVEQQKDDGSFTRRERVDNTAMRRLNASALSLAETRSVQKLGFMPPKPKVASGPLPGQGKQLRQRSSLDYLRALSEEIKKKRERGER